MRSSGPVPGGRAARAVGKTPWALGVARTTNTPMNLLVLFIILLILFGGGGFYWGGPAYGGGGLGLILLIMLIIFLCGGFRGRTP